MSALTSATPTLSGAEASQLELEHQSIMEEPSDVAQHHVDVARAEAAFHELERTFSQRSSKPSKPSTTTLKGAYDAEKAELSPEDQPFDLREYLSSSNDANQQAGIKHKHVGVTWKDLEVNVVGGGDHKAYVRTFADALFDFFTFPILWLWSLISPYLPFKVAAPPTRMILHQSSGVLKPGEMCLVLGCPGSGCTTFLKTIANDRKEYYSVNGEVKYAGIDAAEMAKTYKGEVVYNMEDDIHYATLTVAQTLAFALSTKTPGPNARLPGVTRKQFDKEILETVLKMLNISHTKQTLVGNEFVRGVSGGERKRVSIAEMMATRARVQCWDNSTRGLDASTALDFVKSLRVMTDVLGQTTFVTLYQAGEGIYDLFDKVLVMDEGRQVYYGPPAEARKYFEKLGYKALPRQSTPDYLTGCTDKNERQFASGRDASTVPSSPESLEMTFKHSPLGRENDFALQDYSLLMETERSDQEAFRAAVAADKKRGVSKKAPFTLGFYGQIKSLTKRQFQLRLQDKFQLYTSVFISWVQALVIGGAFFALPPTANGAFTRGSLIFVTVLVSSLEAFGEMPLQMIGRPILNKQTAYSLYRPSALAIANTLADLPFSAPRVFIYNIIVYFMSGLDRSAGGFFTFALFTYLAFLALQGFFRTMGLLATSFDSAFKLAALFIPNMIFYSGYVIPVFQLKRWLFWISYLNPIYYAFSGEMENEFMRIDLDCNGAYVVPRNGPGQNKYPEVLGPNQACTLFGATGGSATVKGSDYISASFQYDTADLWRRNFLVLVGLFFFFQFTQIICMEFFPKYFGAGGASVYAKEDADAKQRNVVLRERKEMISNEKQQNGKGDHEMEVKVTADISTKKVFTWENLNYHVPVPGGTKRLLHDVMGYVKPGTLTALMGASGAGKTTCLDVLAQRKNIGVIAGDVLVDGRPLGFDFARGTAYAEQLDVHEGTATVREALRFSAYLRQPYSVPQEEKDAYVEEILELLELQDLSEALVFSLTVEARKRLTIGVELASKPELLLFLDEPTSGLDGQSAWNLVRFLRKLANQGQAILCTIHQPSSLLFESFDRLLLLERGGETVYFGDIGSDSYLIREYFAKHGAVCPSNVNPAEFMLEAIGAGVSPRIGDRDWKDIWSESDEYKQARQEIADIKAAALAKPQEAEKKISTYATPFWYQMKVVVQRNNVALWRQPDYIFSRLFIHVFSAFFASLALLQLKHSLRDLQYRVFGIFWVTVLPVVIVTQIEPNFIFNRRTFIRESSSRIYSPYVFAIGQLVGEIPYSILCAFAFWVLMVWPMGFGQGAAGNAGNGFQFLVIIFVELFGVTLGQLFAAISPTVQIAVLYNPFMNLILTTFAGVTLPFPTLIPFWRDWMYQLTPYTRVLSAMLSTELHGLSITCNPDEFSIFSPPSGQTCQQWAGDFVSSFGGYLNNANATSNCEYCQYEVGDQYYTPLNISYDNRWRDVWIVFCFFLFNMIATIIASRFLRFAKR